MRHENYSSSPCPVEVFTELVAGKWKGGILYVLGKQTRRFGELRRELPGITTRVLSGQLRELEGDGLVNREDFKCIPPKVEYSLTPLGRQLVPILESMREWGSEYLRLQQESADQ